MNKEKIKPLIIVETFITYFMCRAKKVLRMKKADFHHVCIDIHPDSKTIWIWFHTEEKIIARVQFTFDGKCYNKVDNRE